MGGKNNIKDNLFAIGPKKRICLVAHDNKKQDLLEWVKFNRELLSEHELYATGTTGTLLEKDLDLHIIRLQSGPLGGDQQIGAKITEGVIIAFGKDKHGKDINWGSVMDAGMVLAKIDDSLYAAVIITLGIVPALLIWCSIGMKG